MAPTAGLADRAASDRPAERKVSPPVAAGPRRGRERSPLRPLGGPIPLSFGTPFSDEDRDRRTHEQPPELGAVLHVLCNEGTSVLQVVDGCLWTDKDDPP